MGYIPWIYLRPHCYTILLKPVLVWRGSTEPFCNCDSRNLTSIVGISRCLPCFLSYSFCVVWLNPRYSPTPVQRSPSSPLKRTGNWHCTHFYSHQMAQQMRLPKMPSSYRRRLWRIKLVPWKNGFTLDVRWDHFSTHVVQNSHMQSYFLSLPLVTLLFLLYLTSRVCWHTTFFSYIEWNKWYFYFILFVYCPFWKPVSASWF